MSVHLENLSDHPLPECRFFSVLRAGFRYFASHFSLKRPSLCFKIALKYFNNDFVRIA